MLHRTETRSLVRHAPSALPLAAAVEINSVRGRTRSLPENLLLAALPAASDAVALSNHDPIDLVAGETLTEPGDVAQHAFFPIDSFISLIAPVDHRAQLEVGLVGRRYGGHGADSRRARCAAAGFGPGSGRAWQLDAATLSRAIERSPAVAARCSPLPPRSCWVSLHKLPHARVSISSKPDSLVGCS